MFTHTQGAAGVAVPDTKLAVDATALTRDSTNTILVESSGSAASWPGTETLASTLKCYMSRQGSTTSA